MNSTDLKTLFFKEKERIEPCYLRAVSLLSKGIALYGYGFVGKWAFDFLNSLGADIKIIVDNDKNKQGSFINETPILNSSKVNYSDVNCVIVSSRHAAKAITKSLQNLEIPVISIDAFIVCYYSKTHLESLEQLLQGDDMSVKVLYSILTAMLTGDNSFLRENISFNPLFSEYPFFNIMDEVFLDAGAYVGDTFERFIWSVNGIFKHAYLFEPGKHQFNSMLTRLDRLCKEWCINPQKISCENLALSDTNGQVQFFEVSNPTQSYKISESNAKVVPIETSGISYTNKVSLDSYFKKSPCPPTLIKVDIEGSELDLLNGGIDLISQFTPKIALSIYHYPSDIFLLPIKLSEFSPAYRFSMRHHSCMLMETVLYCY